MSRGPLAAAAVLRHPAARLAVLLGILALCGPALWPGDPLRIDLSRRLSPPSVAFPLGTDQLGRCVLTRTLHAARTSLLAGVTVTAGSLIIGFTVGVISGLAGRRLDRLLMRCVDGVLAFPMMILAVAVTGVLGPSLYTAVFGIILSAWAWWARFVRGITLAARQQPFVQTARIAGVGGFGLVRRYILPQILPEILAAASLNAGAMIVAVSGLGFLGLGAAPPLPEWGAMLKEARIYFIQAPWMMLAPGFGISLSVVAFNRAGEGMRG